MNRHNRLWWCTLLCYLPTIIFGGFLIDASWMHGVVLNIVTAICVSLFVLGLILSVIWAREEWTEWRRSR